MIDIANLKLSQSSNSLKEVAREVQNSDPNFIAATKALKAIESISGSHSAIELIEKALGSNTNLGLLRAYESPFEELRRAGFFGSAIQNELKRTIGWIDECEKRWSAPSILQTSKLVEGLSKDLGNALAFKNIAESIKNPWLDVEDSFGSVQRLADYHWIGQAISQQASLHQDIAIPLRSKLGDWRNISTWPNGIWEDLGLRMDFYTNLGFNEDLIDMWPPAFQEATIAYGIQSDPPSIEDIYGQPVPVEKAMGKEVAFVRTNKAHDWLQRLECQLRHFIDRQMTTKFGPNWPRHRLPNKMYEMWCRKREEASGRRPEQSLIDYADFTDYQSVICKKDNWRDVFSLFFNNVESVRESFNRLRPIRVDTMHSRMISQADELFLYVETKRLSQAMGK